jgi:hypothetical protein
VQALKRKKGNNLMTADLSEVLTEGIHYYSFVQSDTPIETCMCNAVHVHCWCRHAGLHTHMQSSSRLSHGFWQNEVVIHCSGAMLYKTNLYTQC